MRELKAAGTPVRAAGAARYFKTGPGEYGEGDLFLGITVPALRAIERRYRTLELGEVERLLAAKEHECRLAALLILVAQFERGDKAARRAILDLYLRNTRFINNWDLVDASCREIVGGSVRTGSRRLLTKLAKSKSLWERRIAMVSTMALVKDGELEDALRIAEMLLDDEHDLIHKAIGWVLRVVGDVDWTALLAFLKTQYARVPRTALRYAIEHFPAGANGRKCWRESSAASAARSGEREDLEHFGGLWPDTEVGVGLTEGDGAVLQDDEERGQWQAPAGFGRGLVGSPGVHKRYVDQDPQVVAAVLLGDAVSDAELLGEFSSGVRKNWERQVMLLQREVVLTAVLRGDRHEERAQVAKLGVQFAPAFKFRGAVRAPAAAEELNDQRAEREQVGGVDLLAGQRVGQREVRGQRADGQDAVFNAGGEEIRGMLLGDGEPFGLDQRAGVLGDAVEFVLQRGERGPGHDLHIFIIAAMSPFSL